LRLPNNNILRRHPALISSFTASESKNVLQRHHQNKTKLILYSKVVTSSLVRQILFKAALLYAFGRIKPAEIIIHCKCAEDVRRPTGSQLKHSLWLIQIKSHA
jgi:hypothetical protein